MIKILLILGSLFIHMAALGEVLNVEYASFYSHVKKIDDEETNKLRFAFGFKHIAHDRLCKIDSAKIVTQKQTQVLQVENSSRFTVPSEKVLKMAKALVSITLDDNANQCDMSVQLETIPDLLKQKYSHTELNALLVQYQAFFSNMGSFLSFMMPSAEGLVFHFEDNSNLPDELNKLLDGSGNLILDQAWFNSKQSLTLAVTPLRITALIDK